MALVKPEGLAGEEPLLIAGEAHGIGIPQGGIDGPGPNKPFLEVLEGIAVAKPGIKHPVGKNEKGGVGAANGQVGSEEMEIPDAVHHHGVVVVVMGPDPEQEGKGKEAIYPGAAEGLHRHPGKGEIGSAGGIEGCDVEGIAEGVVGGG
jgi:hypothetical protein